MKRKISENIYDNYHQKQRKLDQISTETGSITRESLNSHISYNDHSDNGEDEVNWEKSSSDKTMGVNSFIFRCFHCNDPNVSNENSSKVFDHWKAIQSNSKSSPFLIQIISEKSEKIEISKEHFSPLLSIEHPSHVLQKAEKIENQVEYIPCAEVQFTENKYYDHIQIHAKENDKDHQRTDDESTTSSTSIEIVPNKEASDPSTAISSSDSNHNVQQRELEKQQQLRDETSKQQRGERLIEKSSRISQKFKICIHFETDPMPKTISVNCHDIFKQKNKP